MYESMTNFAYLIAALIAVLACFGAVMSMIGNTRFLQRWDKIDNLCDRRDELYIEFIKEGWTPPEQHSFRSFYECHYQEALAA